MRERESEREKERVKDREGERDRKKSNKNYIIQESASPHVKHASQRGNSISFI